MACLRAIEASSEESTKMGRRHALAELVLDHRNLLAVLRRQDVVQERRLARAEEAGEDGDGDLVRGRGFRASRCFLAWCSADSMRLARSAAGWR